MSRIEDALKELRLAVESPRAYLASFFRDLENQIDLECETFLNRPNVSGEDKERAIQQQIQMINEVGLFQHKCLANLATIPLDDSPILGAVGLEVEEREVFRALYRRQRSLFMNQGIIFFNNSNFDQFLQSNLHFYLLSFKYENPLQLFGLLFIIEDEFLISSDITDQMLSVKKIQDDWCNECLRLVWMRKGFERLGQEKSNVVRRVQLNMTQQNSLYLKGFHLNTRTLNEWTADLVALRSVSFFGCQLKELERAMFRSLPNLEDLRLSSNEIAELDAALFAGCSALKRLYLNGNKIAWLDRRIFRGLGNLSDLVLSRNLLTSIPEGLFLDLVNLRNLNLSGNRIDFLSGQEERPSAFKGLARLKYLDLGNNLISSVPAGTFRGLDSLESLYLGGNKISLGGQTQDNHRPCCSFLRDLTHLKMLDIVQNFRLQIVSSDGSRRTLFM